MGRFSSRLKNLLGSSNKKKAVSGQTAPQCVQQSVSRTSQEPASPQTQPQSDKKALDIRVVERQVSADDVVEATNNRDATNGKADLWTAAYHQLEQRQPELASDYIKHINTFMSNNSNSHLRGLGNSESLVSKADPADSLIDLLLRNRERKQWRIPLLHKDIKIRSQVEKFVKFCLFTDGIVKEALSNQPFAALAWSGVSILLPLLSTGKSQHEAMLGGYEYIGKLQLYWKIYEQENPCIAHAHDSDIRKALTKLYSLIIEYQARAVCHLSSAQLSRSWQKLADSNSWEGHREAIADMDSHCNRLVSDSDRERIKNERDLQLKEIQESRAILSDIREGLDDLRAHAEARHNDELESTLLSHLSSEYEHYKNVNPPRVHGTCEWFLNDDGFREWRALSASSLLWLSASPGYGKSVLSRCLIDENLLSNNATTSIVCYFFFKTGAQGQMDSASALSSVLHQLFIQDPTGEMIKIGLASHKNYGDKLRRNFAELWRILLACANSYPSSEIIIVLDALDECSEESREKLINALDTLFVTRAANLTLKFLITGRPYGNLESAFEGQGKNSGFISVDGDEKSEDINKEINLVIDVKVEEISQYFSEKHRKMISDRLKGMENRTYLWLHLTFDIIKEQRSRYSKASQIQDLLDNIPDKIFDAYEVILDRGTEKQDDQTITRILLQIILAATRPLTIDEANYALTIATSKRYLPTNAAIVDDLWARERFKTVVKDLSGLFITVVDSRLSFIHLTAREFLTDQRKQGNWHGHFRMDSCHATTTLACMNYLTAVDIRNLDPTASASLLSQNFPFLPYAMESWTIHYNFQDEYGRRNLCEKAKSLCDVSGGRDQHMLELYGFFQESIAVIDTYKAECTTLNLATALGLDLVVADLVEDLRKDADRYSDIYLQTLLMASYEGHAGVVQVLLRSTEDKGLHRQHDSMGFGAALLTRKTDVMRVFLDNSKDVHIVHEELLMEAMARGDVKLVGLLLDRLGNEIILTEDVVDMAMSNHDHGVEVVELLLDRRGKEIKFTDRLVEAAASNFRSATGLMALLLDRRRNEVNLTKEVVRAAVGNMDCGRDTMALLIARREIAINEELLLIAAGNHGCGDQMVEALVNEHDVGSLLSDKIIDSMAANRKFGTKMLSTTFAAYPHGVSLVTTKTLETAAGNIGCGAGITDLLLDARGDVTITPATVMNAIQNKFCGSAVLEMLLERRGDEVRVTEEMLAAAGRNEKRGAELTALLLDKQSSDEAADQKGLYSNQVE